MAAYGTGASSFGAKKSIKDWFAQIEKDKKGDDKRKRQKGDKGLNKEITVIKDEKFKPNE